MGSDVHLAHLHETTTFFNGEYNAVNVTITICNALALYNAIELLILIFATFQRYAGLYFWALVIASSGILPYVFGFECGYFQLAPQLVYEIIATIGWPMMVTGQSLVLYSRLGVVLGPDRERILKAVKWMIIVDAIVFHVSTTVVVFGAYNAQPHHNWAQAYKYIEKIQMTGFTIQELIISGLYLWCTLHLLQSTNVMGSKGRRKRHTVLELFSINILIVMFDVALLVVEYQNRHVIEQALKAVVYSVKLKCEFVVLRKLVTISQRNARMSQDTFITAAGTDAERGNSDISEPTFHSPKYGDRGGAVFIEKI